MKGKVRGPPGIAGEVMSEVKQVEGCVREGDGDVHTGHGQEQEEMRGKMQSRGRW